MTTVTIVKFICDCHRLHLTLVSGLCANDCLHLSGKCVLKPCFLVVFDTMDDSHGIHGHFIAFPSILEASYPLYYNAIH